MKRFKIISIEQDYVRVRLPSRKVIEYLCVICLLVVVWNVLQTKVLSNEPSYKTEELSEELDPTDDGFLSNMEPSSFLDKIDKKIDRWFERKSPYEDHVFLDSVTIYITDGVEFIKSTTKLAKKLDIEPMHLLKVMHTESKFNPVVRNYKGSGAIGLIQFMASTLKDHNLTPEDIQTMSWQTQLKVVERYFKNVKHRSNVRDNGGLKTLTDVYLAVFFPAAIGQGSSFKIASRGQKRYAQNSGLDFDKDGHLRVDDITNYYEAKYSLLDRL